MEQDKLKLVKIPAWIYKRLLKEKAKTTKSTSLLIVEAIIEKYK